MGPGDSGRGRERTSRGPPGGPGRAGLWLPVPRPALGSPRGGRGTDVAAEASATSQLLEDMGRRLVRALQRAVPRGGSRRAREAAAAAREEQGRTRVEGVLAGLRSELLEMHLQNRQLARTLLDLNMKMQQLKEEYEQEMVSESQRPEDNALNPK
ncbi:alanine and arginine-rich domain-containing protein [Cynocephalus volans]|uniref:alanine and arginine-rich domain-containing protein n=1 Tax=Cynocephalus volans TaxID=110931 RepID=UPI002FCC5C27